MRLRVLERIGCPLDQVFVGGRILGVPREARRQGAIELAPVVFLLVGERGVQPFVHVVDLFRAGAAQEHGELVAVQAVGARAGRKRRLDALGDQAYHGVAEHAVVAVVHVAEVVDAQDHERGLVVRVRLQRMDGRVLELELVEQAGRAIHVVLLAQIGDEAREQAGFPHGVLDETAAATQPHPFATPVERAVLDAVARRAPVGDLLVRFQERGTVVFVHMGAPDGGRVLDHLARQAELFHHRRRIAEHARLHVADVQVVVGAFHQRVVQAVLVVIEGRAGHDGVAASGSVRRARRDAVTALFVARDVVGPLLVVHAHVGQVQHVARVGSAARNHFHDAEAECAVVGMVEALVFLRERFRERGPWPRSPGRRRGGTPPPVRRRSAGSRNRKPRTRDGRQAPPRG